MSEQQIYGAPIGLAGDERDPEATHQLGLASGDRCVVCSSPLTSDQRYCVVCGERRGKPRFTLAEPTAATAAQPAAPAASRLPRFSSGTTLVAGIATLLLAMGVGVLIGHDTATGAKSSGGGSHITVLSGGSAAATPTTATSGAGSTGSGHSSGAAGSGAKASSAAKSSSATSHKAAAAASKVLGGSAKTPPPTVTVGAKGSGSGYQHHKFTGNFFGN